MTTLNRIISIFILWPLIQCGPSAPKAQQSEAKAYSEVKSVFSDPIDRIYLYYFERDGFQGDITKKEKPREEPSKFTVSKKSKDYLRPEVKPIKDASVLHMTGCFDEPVDPEACVPLPTDGNINNGQRYKISNDEYCQEPGEHYSSHIRANRRQYFDDFPMANIGFKTSKSKRSGKCIPLLSGQSLGFDFLNVVEEQARLSTPNGWDYARAAVSAGSCFLVVGSIAKPLVMSKLSGAVNGAAKSSSYPKVAKIAQGLINTKSKAARIFSPIGGLIAKARARLDKVDDIAEDAVDLSQSMVKRLLAEISKKAGHVKAAGVTGVSVAISKVLPRASRAIAQSLGYDSSELDGIVQNYVDNKIKDVKTKELDKIYADFEVSVADSQVMEEVFEAYLNSKSLNAYNMAYFGAVMASLVVPMASCGLAVVDIYNIFDKKRTSANYRDLRTVMEHAVIRAKNHLRKSGNKRFLQLDKEIEAIRREIGDTQFTMTSKLGANFAGYKDKIEEYLQYLYPQVAWEFNYVETAEKFAHSLFDHQAAFKQIANLQVELLEWGVKYESLVEFHAANISIENLSDYEFNKTMGDLDRSLVELTR